MSKINVINNASYSVTASLDVDVSNGSIVVGNRSAATTAPQCHFLKSRSGSNISTGDVLGNISFKGYDPTPGYTIASSIISTSSGTIANNRVASDLKFYTHPDSAGSSVLRLTIAATGACTIASPDSGTALTVGSILKITAGNVTISSGDLVGNRCRLVATTSTKGQVKINSVCNLHAISFSGTVAPIYIGANAGNFTVTVAAGHITAAGVYAGNSNSTPTSYLAIGFEANRLGDSPSSATYIGWKSGRGMSDGDYEYFYGCSNGSAYTGVAEDNNILIGYGIAGVNGEKNVLRIGTATGTGNGELNQAYIHGIYDKSVGATAKLLCVDSSSVIGTIDGSSNTALIGGGAPSFSATVTLTDLTATTLTSTNIYTNVTTSQLKLSGTTIAADGSNTDIDVTITPKGTGGLKSAAVYSKAVGGTNAAMYVDNSGYIGIVSSSVRFKENIKDMGDRSNFLSDLRPVIFNYKSDETKQEKFGLIAEEVAKIYPSLVSFDEYSEPYTVSYHDLPVLILNQLKKAKKRVEILEKIVKERGLECLT